MKIALIQICSQLDPSVNLAKIDQFVQTAKKQCPDLTAVFLPEVFYSMSDGTCATPYLVEMNNNHFQAIQKLVLKHQVYFLGGSVAALIHGQVVNRSLNFDPTGQLIAYYDKMHLFSIDYKQKKTVLDEAEIYQAGTKLQTFDWHGFKVGLSVCFDLRFPELYRAYFKQGVNLFSVSSAFTPVTGKAHWLTLLKARAIENQSYVVACGQWGQHNDHIATWGHSCVIDPWGEVLTQCPEGEGVAICELDRAKLDEIRGRMNMQPILT